MRLILGRLENSRGEDTRIFGDHDGYLVDLSLAYATYLAQVEKQSTYAYALADLYFPSKITSFLERGEASREALARISIFLKENDLRTLKGPSGERLLYRPLEVKLLTPIRYPDKVLVIGFSDQVKDIDKKLAAKIPTAFYKLTSSLIDPGEDIHYPKFTHELDCDACIGLVIGKAGRRTARERAWEYVAGFTLLLDVTARDACMQESLTRNSLLGKNASSSTSIGPSVFVIESKQQAAHIGVELAIDGRQKQKFMLSDLIFSAEDVVSHWSTIGLSTGDIIALGANLALKSGLSQGPAILTAGNTIRCFSSDIGELVHRVVDENRSGG